MSDVKRDFERYRLDPDDAADDDIEIIEVVGLDETDESVLSDPQEAAEEDEDTHEIVLDLDEEDTDPLASTGNAVDTPRPDTVPASREREQLLRLQADFDNFKKRVEREREADRRHAAAHLVTNLLEVLDNFERALGMEPQANADGAFRDGMVLVFKQLLEELRKVGLEAIDSLGQPFDPALHEAVATDTRSGLPSHTVVEELQRGYLLNGRMLRPALVKVSVDPGESPYAEHGQER